MRDARFTIPTPALLAKVVDLLDEVPLDRRDTNGDLYEYMLGKLSTSGQNGQFRTPRHIMNLMVAMTDPRPDDVICDPACGTGGFLVAASEHLLAEYPSVRTNAAQRHHFHHSAFHGYDFDSTMLRISSMNMMMHGVESPDIAYRDSLSGAGDVDAEEFSLVLANPPFKGSLDAEAVSKLLLSDVKTKKTALLFLARFLRLLKPGGRAAVVVPDGVLFDKSNAHKTLRRKLIEDHKLDAVVKLPVGAFEPYTGVSTAILLFTKTNSGGTENVWFYSIRADGWSLDKKRTALLDDSLLGCRREVEGPSGTKFEPLALTAEQHEKNNLPDVLARWRNLDTEADRKRTEQSFMVPKADIVAAGYDLSLNRYKEIECEDADTRDPLEIIAELEELEAEIQQGLAELKAMLS